MKKYIHVIAGLSLALAVTGCANDDDSVVSQAAAAAIQRSQDDGSKLNASIAANLSAISALKTNPRALPVTVTGTVTAGDIAVLKAELKKLNNENAVAPATTVADGAAITVDFSGASFVNNTISGEAFKYCRKVTKVILPNSVTKFDGWGTFNETGRECTSFTMATPSGDNKLPSGLTDLGPCAFGWDNNMTSISIPDSVKTLTGTFISCQGLTSVEIGSGVTEFVDEGGVNGVFRGCGALSSITYRGTKSQWNNITKGANTFATLYWSGDPSSPKDAPSAKYVQCTDGKVWLIGLTPAVVTALNTIESADAPVTVAFGSITLTGDDWTAIKETVKNASQLVTLDFTGTTLPGDITYVPAYAFQQCTKLAGITLPATVTSIRQYAFEGCDFLTTINLGNVTTIDGSAFAGCSRLGTVNLSSATAIGASAFQNTALSSVTIPATVNVADSIGNQAFANCNSLTSVTYGGTADQFKTAIGSNATTIFPATVKKVACTPGALYHVNSNWLAPSDNCMGYLGQFIRNIENVSADYTSSKINSSTASLTENDLEIIKQLVKDSRYTLYLDMSNATFPNNKVPMLAFAWCAKLVGIDLPTAITQIGQGAFGNCTALTDVTIPAAVTELRDGAFTGCTTLATVTFGASGSTPVLNTIGGNCFANCTSLNTVNYWGTETNWTSITKNNGYKTGVNLTTFKVSLDGSNLSDASAVSVF